MRLDPKSKIKRDYLKYLKERYGAHIEDVESGPQLSRCVADPELILQFYQQGLSVDGITKHLSCEKGSVLRALKKYGIHFNTELKPLFFASDLPFGWKENAERLVPHSGEQWILDKIEADVSQGVSLAQISSTLNSARIKTKSKGDWNPDMVSRVVKKNRRLKQLLLSENQLKGTGDERPRKGDVLAEASLPQ